jgi:hypothetical protein
MDVLLSVFLQSFVESAMLAMLLWTEADHVQHGW